MDADTVSVDVKPGKRVSLNENGGNILTISCEDRLAFDFIGCFNSRCRISFASGFEKVDEEYFVKISIGDLIFVRTLECSVKGISYEKPGTATLLLSGCCVDFRLCMTMKGS